jgi:hypothetical protein
MAVSYNDAGERAGLPRHLFAKTTPHLRSRLTLGPSGKLAAETGFYNSVRPLLDIEATRALHSAHDRSSARSIILFEDLVKLQGCTFCDPTVYIDRAKAESMVSLLASYHGRMWESPLLGSAMTTFAYQSRINRAMAFAKRSFVGLDRAAAVMPPQLIHIDRAALWEAHMRSLEINSQAPLTLTHWDMHIGNWYATRDGRMGLSDWGMLRGQWAADYTYAIVSALTVADRRAWERDLLAIYLDKLAAAGGKPPRFDEAWLALRQQAFHPLFYWLVTIGAGPLQENMQPDSISLINLERMGQAFVDYDAMGSMAR